jgi:hypothetical protein
MLKEYRDNHLLFLYEASGQIWGQWWCKPGSLKRWPTKRDKESPDPPKHEYETWVSTYVTPSKALPKTSEVFRNLTKIHENPPRGDGVGVGVGEEKVNSVYSPNGNGYDSVSGARRFMADYPGEINDLIAQLFISVVKSQDDEALLFTNLYLHKKSKKWRDGFIPTGENFLSKGIWRYPPPPKELSEPPSPYTLADSGE